MPQGGIDPGESEISAAYRELGEETGVADHLALLKQVSNDWLYYDLPTEMVPLLWDGRYRGQQQKWYLFDFIGDDKDININTESSRIFKMGLVCTC